MATKKQIAEQALRILSGGHIKPDRTLDIRELMLSLDQGRDARVRIDTFENVKNGTYTVEEDYLSFYSAVAVAATTEGMRSCAMPANTIALYGGLSTYQVAPVGDQESPFIIIQPGEVGLLAGTSAVEHEDNVYCWVIGGTMYFKNLAVGVTEVTMMLAVSSKDIAEDADYPVPPDVEDELLKQLVQMFSAAKQVQHDEAEDGIK